MFLPSILPTIFFSPKLKINRKKFLQQMTRLNCLGEFPIYKLQMPSGSEGKPSEIKSLSPMQNISIKMKCLVKGNSMLLYSFHSEKSKDFKNC